MVRFFVTPWMRREGEKGGGGREREWEGQREGGWRDERREGENEGVKTAHLIHFTEF